MSIKDIDTTDANIARIIKQRVRLEAMSIYTGTEPMRLRAAKANAKCIVRELIGDILSEIE